jgi:hypothetical protein
MKKILIIITLFVFFIGYTQNTQNEDFQNFQKAFPKTPIAPTTYSFIREGEVPVSDYTGTLNYSLNLYTIESGNIKIPLTLNYVGGNGIKVNEEASWVGLGWNLTLPTISQVVNDVDDLSVERKFIRPDYFNSSPYPSLLFQPLAYAIGSESFNFDNSPNIPIANIQRNNGVHISLNEYGYYNGIAQRKEDILYYPFDSEPDYFILNLFGESIKFISKLSSNNQLYFEILNRTSYKIEIIGNNNFKVTDDKGVKYYFEDKEVIYQSGNISVTNRNWVISKIENNNVIIAEFKYDNFSIKNLPQISQRFNKTTYVSPNVAAGAVHFGLFSTLDSTAPVGGINFDGFVRSVGGNALNIFYSYSYQNELVLKEIDFLEGKILFQSSTRDDSAMKKLDSILVKNKNNETVKNINFGYDYFLSDLTIYNCFTTVPYSNFYGNNLNYPENYIQKRLKLVTVNNFEEKPYSFVYNSTLLPPKCSFAKDYWGFSNGKFTNTSLIPNPIHFPGKEYLGNNGNDLRANEYYCKSAILEEVIYPTGGVTKFSYELNQADNFFYDYVSDIIENGDGLRIKTVTNYNETSFVSKKKYSYSNGKSQSIKSFFTNRTLSYSVLPLYDEVIETTTFVSIDANSSINSSAFESNSIVGYDKVEISDLDEFGNNKGKIITSYFNVPDTPFKVVNYDFSLPSTSYKTNQNGNVLQKEYFDSNNMIIKKDIFEYNFYLSNLDYGVKTSSIGFMTTTTLSPIADLDPMSLYAWCDASLYGCYPIYSFETRLLSKTETDYFNGNPISKVTNYGYNNRRFLQSESFESSDHTILSKQYFHSSDKLSEPYMSTLSLVNNNFSEIIESNSYRNGDQLYRFKTNYAKDATTSNLILPKEVFSNKGNNYLERKVVYDSYDSIGNITQYTQENGIPVTIIWGYSNTLPIAKIENVLFSNIQNSMSTIQNSSVNDTEAVFLSNLNSFRSAILLQYPSCNITTFTHKPLIGVSTITDVKGDKATYFYDNYNRLLNVKDKNDNIISQNLYHFKN